MVKILIKSMAMLVVAMLLSSCGSHRNFVDTDPHWKDNDDKNIADPGKRDPLLEWDTVDRTVFEQAEQILDLRRSLRKVIGRPEQANNINSLDEVPNSSWYTNRHAFRPMTNKELKLGVATTDGPDTSGIWTVWKPKVQGQTPGLFIIDEKGDRYILKFDPKSHPDLATSAAAITSRFLFAMGYNVPQETIVYWHPDKLRIKEGLMFEDRKGTKRPFTEQDLLDIFDRVHIEPDGSIRSLASKFLPNIRGPFSFDGRRKNDPNDWCDHEHRRELRALYVFCSMVNHFDIKDQNTMDIYANENGRRYLKHYLLDFGSTLGSAGHGPMDPRAGYANSFDLRDAFISLITLGLKKWQWEDAKPYRYASIGYFESEIFHPAKWDPIYPIPAFEEMTYRDAYWAAKQVMALSDNDIRALVEAGQIRDREAREYLIQTLIERRDKIGRHWFSKVTPLDHFRLSNETDKIVINFEDLAVKYGLESDYASYKLSVTHLDHKFIDSRVIRDQTIMLDANDLAAIKAVHNDPEAKQKTDNNLIEMEITTIRNGEKLRPTLLWLWYQTGNESFRLVGIEHLDRGN